MKIGLKENICHNHSSTTLFFLKFTLNAWLYARYKFSYYFLLLKINNRSLWCACITVTLEVCSGFISLSSLIRHRHIDDKETTVILLHHHHHYHKFFYNFHHPSISSFQSTRESRLKPRQFPQSLLTLDVWYPAHLDDFANCLFQTSSVHRYFIRF